MGIGPVPAIKAALNKADKSLQHMELIEVLKLRCTVNCRIFLFCIVVHSLECVIQVKALILSICVMDGWYNVAALK